MDGRRSRRRRGGYGRFLARSVAGTLIPGVGLIAAGRRRVGFAVLAVFLAGVAAVLWYATQVDFTDLVRMGSDSAVVQRVGYALIGLAVFWVGVGLIGFVLLEPDGLSAGRRFTAALVMVLAGSLIAVPFGLAAQRAFTHQELLDTVFADDDEHPDTTPTGATDEDPWAGESRVNVLLLGSDSGPGRDGTRTDTIMVASIDVETGDSLLFSLPRNLQYAPMPEGELRDAYPDGYRGPEEEAYYWLSAVYRNLPVEFPDLFGEYRDPGAEAMKLVVGSALGLTIDYYAMVDLNGFQDIVNALGGITMDVPYDIPIGTRDTGYGCSEPLGWVRAGQNKQLDGFEALWVARARCGPGEVNGDYSRMRRQRCVIAAIADKADPQTLLLKYQSIASAAKNTVSTDIPQSRLSAFVELGSRVKDGQLRSLPFTDEIIDYYSPDYDLIHDLVDEALAAPVADPTPTGDATPEWSGTPDPSGTPGSTGTPDAEGSREGDESEGAPDDAEAPDGSETPGDEDDAPPESDGAQSVDDVC